MQKSSTNASYKMVFTLVILVAVVIIFFVGGRPAHVEVSSERVTISGMYGTEIPVHEITQLELRDALPRVISRTNGMDLFGTSRRGMFNMEELGRTRLFSFSSEGPYVVFKTAEEWVVINYKDTQETRSLFANLQAVVQDE